MQQSEERIIEGKLIGSESRTHCSDNLINLKKERMGKEKFE